jgi:hypothetical protein
MGVFSTQSNKKGEIGDADDVQIQCDGFRY